MPADRPCSECPYGPWTNAGCPESCPPGFSPEANPAPAPEWAVKISTSHLIVSRRNDGRLAHLIAYVRDATLREAAAKADLIRADAERSTWATAGLLESGAYNRGQQAGAGRVSSEILKLVGTAPKEMT